MLREELIEEGVVVNSSNGIAEILLIKNKNCDKCTANILCTPGKNNSAIIKALDTFNTKSGDTVKISIYGNQLIKLSFLIYGLPLILFVAGIVLSNIIFQSSEFISILSGLLFSVFYFFILKLKRNFLNKIFLPRIVNVITSNK